MKAERLGAVPWSASCLMSTFDCVARRQTLTSHNRYYVSPSLMRSATGQRAQGWRIPALKIEHKLAERMAARPQRLIPDLFDLSTHR